MGGPCYYTAARVIDPETSLSTEVVTGLDFATGEVLLERPDVHPENLLDRPNTHPHRDVHWVIEMLAAFDDPCVAELRGALEQRGWVVTILEDPRALG